ncbi:MAG: (d)CMP kinase [Clostridiales Family XIII bacterium]|jgi:cytidylate kinase|nr:(d)CMP kinase [Clostridiales Family XIII bacterium]
MKIEGLVRIAMDGPSGAGKSTVAKRIAAALSIVYIDTGAMYRAVAYKILATGTDIDGDLTGLAKLLEETDVDFADGRTVLDGRDVSELIRTAEVTAMASRSAAIPIVREKLVALQRKMGAEKSVVMDGRDIGSNVFPDAEFKFFITASPEERAKRRFAEIAAESPMSYEEVLAAIKARDYNDSHRAVNPLVKTDDAIEVNTDGLDIDGVTQLILGKIVERRPKEWYN